MIRGSMRGGIERNSMMRQGLTPETLLLAYANGVFPMAEHEDDPSLFWVDPKRRGILPLDGFRISRSLARTIRQQRHVISHDTAFEGVLTGCAARDQTWINQPLRALYTDLFHTGHAHSTEVRGADGQLIGGVFGVALGGAFFGESMFSTARDASKIALAYLVDRLRAGGFTLFDTQFITPHLHSLGAQEISRAAYRRRLAEALEVEADFHRQGPVAAPYSVLQRNGQTS